LNETTHALCDRLTTAARAHDVPFSARNVGGMFGMYFRAEAPRSFAEVMQCDVALFNRFFHGMLAAGVYFAPSAFEAGFVSSAHSAADVEKTAAAAARVFESLKDVTG
jgi:glutamate-1-semialdehyde 2,1-aminomutase